jgi:hypothetical protein
MISIRSSPGIADATTSAPAFKNVIARDTGTSWSARRIDQSHAQKSYLLWR